MTTSKGGIGVKVEALKPQHPVYLRLPREGARCPFTDLPRSTLKDLCIPARANNYKPPVRSISLRKSKYAKRGIRLIDYNSLMKYLRSKFQKARNGMEPPTIKKSARRPAERDLLLFSHA
jgi:hypothetical protein